MNLNASFLLYTVHGSLSQYVSGFDCKMKFYIILFDAYFSQVPAILFCSPLKYGMHFFLIINNIHKTNNIEMQIVSLSFNCEHKET